MRGSQVWPPSMLWRAWGNGWPLRVSVHPDFELGFAAPLKEDFVDGFQPREHGGGEFGVQTASLDVKAEVQAALREGDHAQLIAILHATEAPDVAADEDDSTLRTVR